MGFNKRKMEDQRRHLAEKEAKARRATEKQILEDADHLVAVWNERQAKWMPMLFSPTIGAAITAGRRFLWVRCPACRTMSSVELRSLDRHRNAAVTSLIPALSKRPHPHSSLVKIDYAQCHCGRDVMPSIDSTMRNGTVRSTRGAPLVAR